ncbi:MAG: sigma-70 family RNA polymerase sigma factor [Planctomycetes bacterium]|nr:sigma-70 family RNA polymerase sigma factor [Planctomycetota bacterium]
MSTAFAVATDPMPDPRVAFEDLIRRHQTAVWRYLRALGARPDAAEELLQETFVVAWQKGVEDRGVLATGTFLRRIARNLLLRQRRAQGRRDELLIELADSAWQRDCVADDGEAWLLSLQHCRDQLPERARAAIDGWYGGANRDGVAATLGLHPDGLKTLLQRARALLRACIERHRRNDP